MDYLQWMQVRNAHYDHLRDLDCVVILQGLVFPNLLEQIDAGDVFGDDVDVLASLQALLEG